MRLIALAILALATLLPTWAARATPIDRANAQADHFIRTTMAAQRIPGLQLAVVKDGRIVLSRSYGLANVENNIATRAQTLFPLNSATKSFTGVAVMQLVEAGQLDLQAPISRYLAALPATWHTVRVQQLLDHTSGLPDILDEHGLVGSGSELTAWNTITQRAPEAAPGERFRYNQTNYALLARIIATQSQMSYPQYLAKHQFGPAQMPLSTFGDSYDLVADSATMYSYFPRSSDDPGRAPRLSHWFYDMPEGLWAGGGILTTADEVAHWMLALLRGQLLSADSRARMWTVAALNDGSDGSWAGGWPRLSPAPDLQVGGVGGARSAFIVYPDDDLAVIVLSNLVGANPQDFIGDIAAFYRMPAAARLNRAGRPSPAGSRR